MYTTQLLHTHITRTQKWRERAIRRSIYIYIIDGVEMK